jgi:hypothetical protein
LGGGAGAGGQAGAGAAGALRTAGRRARRRIWHLGAGAGGLRLCSEELRGGVQRSAFRFRGGISASPGAPAIVPLPPPVSWCSI